MPRPSNRAKMASHSANLLWRDPLGFWRTVQDGQDENQIRF
jgi:hypothetical protein